MKTKKDMQTEEHRCHSESAITQAVSVKKTKEDTRTEEHVCHSEGAITGAGGVKQTKASGSTTCQKKVKDYECQRTEGPFCLSLLKSR